MALEALGLHISLMEQDGDALPEASIPPFTEELPDKAIIMPVSVFPELVQFERDSRTVQTNITLPVWLKEWAAAQGINLSHTLQSTLRQMYDA
jgi:hypothetical protein